MSEKEIITPNQLRDTINKNYGRLLAARAIEDVDGASIYEAHMNRALDDLAWFGAATLKAVSIAPFTNEVND